MICIVGGRGSGKTSALIKVSGQTGIPIAVHSRREASRIARAADAMGVAIPAPMAAEFRGSFVGRRRRVLVDEAQTILEEAIGCPVEVCALDARSFDFSSMGFLEMVAEWLKARRVEVVS